MIRNDYRRALIMLRALEKGYSGHVRLERRTLRGNMPFSITAPSGGELHAFWRASRVHMQRKTLALWGAMDVAKRA